MFGVGKAALLIHKVYENVNVLLLNSEEIFGMHKDIYI